MMFLIWPQDGKKMEVMKEVRKAAPQARIEMINDFLSVKTHLDHDQRMDFRCRFHQHPLVKRLDWCS